MARQDKRQRRAARRRQVEMPQPPQRGGVNWQIIAGAAVVLVVAALLVGLGIYNNNRGPSTATAAQKSQNSAPRVDGLIGCDQMTTPTYHVHVHLTVMNHGKLLRVPLYSGLNYNHDCLYWMHVHDQSGIVHIESPRKIVPTLGTWYDVMKLPLSASQAGGARVKSGDQMKIWVGNSSSSGSNAKTVFHPYTGNPRDIKLLQHTQIWIDVGSPYIQPTSFNFAKFGV
jgi:hypothetical protein